METTVFLVRHGETDWHKERRVLGTRDIGLNAQGINQAHAIVRALGDTDIAEVLTSPLLRAAQTAEVIAGAINIQMARDPRLTDFRVGHWEGMHYEEVAADPEYQSFLRDPLSERIPGGERLSDIRDRAVASVTQALSDNGGENLLIVTHAGIIRVLLVHYLGATLGSYHRLRISPGSISILRFVSDKELPRLLAMNYVSRPVLTKESARAELEVICG